MPDALRQGHSTVILEHIAVQGVELGVVDVGGEHAIAQIIQHHNGRADAFIPGITRPPVPPVRELR